MTTVLSFKPYRFENESQSEYRQRQKLIKTELKAQKRGKVFWDSYSKGTYKKAK